MEVAEIKMPNSSLPTTRIDRMRNEYIYGTVACWCAVELKAARPDSDGQRRDSEYISGGMQRLEPLDRRPRGRTKIYGCSDGCGMKRTELFGVRVRGGCSTQGETEADDWLRLSEGNSCKEKKIHGSVISI